MTFVDIRLFMTLIRFDEVYVVYFKVRNNVISVWSVLKVLNVSILVINLNSATCASCQLTLISRISCENCIKTKLFSP